MQCLQISAEDSLSHPSIGERLALRDCIQARTYSLDCHASVVLICSQVL